MLQAGAIVADHLRLVRQLGSGGMGSVWVAEQTRLGGLVAVKFLSTALLDHESARSRFDREAKLAAKIKSQHVVQVHDHGLTNGDPPIPYIVMELLEGTDLSKVLDREGPLGVARTAELLDQISDALTKAHDAGIVHRDIKPENVFVLDEARTFIKLLDFGVAHGRDGQLDRLTQTGLLLGTAHYMSPEQLFSGKDIDLRADLWALGVLVYQTLTNEVPFQAETFGQLCLQVRDGSFPPVSSKVNVPPGVDQWFTKALSTDRQARFQTAVEMAKAFRRVISGEPLEATATGFAGAAQTAGTGTVRVDKSEVSRLREEVLRANSSDGAGEHAPPRTQRFGSRPGFGSGATQHASESDTLSGDSSGKTNNPIDGHRLTGVSSEHDGTLQSGRRPGASTAREIAGATPLADLSGSFGTEAKGVLALDPRSTEARSPRWGLWTLAALALGGAFTYVATTQSSETPPTPIAEGGLSVAVTGAPTGVAEVVHPSSESKPATSLVVPTPSADDSVVENAAANGDAPSTIAENTVTGQAASALPMGTSSTRGPKPSGGIKAPRSNGHASADKPSPTESAPTASPASQAEPPQPRRPKYRGF